MTFIQHIFALLHIWHLPHGVDFFQGEPQPVSLVVMSFTIVLRVQAFVTESAEVYFRLQMFPLDVFTHVAAICLVTTRKTEIGSGPDASIVVLFRYELHTWKSGRKENPSRVLCLRIYISMLNQRLGSFFRLAISWRDKCKP